MIPCEGAGKAESASLQQRSSVHQCVFSAWALKRGIRLEYIQPGKPQQNAYTERYNPIVRYDWLEQYLLEFMEQVQESATRWLWTYNNESPNMGLGGIIPKTEAGHGGRILLVSVANNGGLPSWFVDSWDVHDSIASPQSEKSEGGSTRDELLHAPQPSF